jgi:hypothetical protein
MLGQNGLFGNETLHAVGSCHEPTTCDVSWLQTTQKWFESTRAFLAIIGTYINMLVPAMAKKRPVSLQVLGQNVVYGRIIL